MKPRVALIHDWLTGMREGEKILEVFCELYPEADIYTLLHVPGSVSEIIEKHSINTSFLNIFLKSKNVTATISHSCRAPSSLDLKDATLFNQQSLRCQRMPSIATPFTSVAASHPCGTSGTSTTAISVPTVHG